MSRGREEGGRPARDVPSREPGLFDALARPVPAPDLAPAIMGRLGFMHAAPAAVRRRRVRRVIARSLMVLGGVTVVAAALALHVAGPNARKPVGPTIPTAITHEVDLHQRRLSRTIRSIRSLAPRLAPVGPVVDPGADAPRRPATEADHRLELESIDEAIDRSAVGPVRWL